MIPLIARLFGLAASKVASQRAAIGLGVAGTVAGDFINLDWLRQEAFKMAPGSDKEALEEAARTVSRMLNLEGEEVLWPRRRDGTPIAPNYMIMDMNKGRAWFSSQYYSRKSVRGAQKRGSSRGFGRGQRSIATLSQAQGR